MLEHLLTILAVDLREIRRLLAYHEEKTQQYKTEEECIIDAMEQLKK